MDTLIAIELSTILPLFQAIELLGHLLVLTIMTECSLSLDCHLRQATHLKCKLQIITLMCVAHQHFTVSTPLPHKVIKHAHCNFDLFDLLSDLDFLLDGQLYPNNSIVTVDDIGGSFFMSALFCLTPSLECCSDSETPNAASVTREWYLPDGRSVTSVNSPFIKTRVSSAVSLHHDPFDSSTAPSGVYRCEIPDASGVSQNIYVGIYPLGDGEFSIIILVKM